MQVLLSLSTDKPTKIGASDSDPRPSDAESEVLEKRGSLVPKPQDPTEAEPALLVGSDHFELSSEGGFTAWAAIAIHHPVLSPARLLAFVGLRNKAAELFFEQALACELTGNRAEALRLYQQAIETWRSSYSTDKNKRIAETFERMVVIETDPSQQNDYMAQAAIHWTQHAKGLLEEGQSGEAMGVLKKAIAFSQKAGGHLDQAQRNTLYVLNRFPC